MAERESDNPGANFSINDLGVEITKLKTASGYGPVPFMIVYGEFLEFRKITGITSRQIMVKIVAAHKDDQRKGKGEILYLWLRQIYHKFWPNGQLDGRIAHELIEKRREVGRQVGVVLCCSKPREGSGFGDSGNGDRITEPPPRGQNPTVPNLIGPSPSAHRTSSPPSSCLNELLRAGRRSPFPPPLSPLPTKPDRDRPTFVPPAAGGVPAQDSEPLSPPVKPDGKGR
jgi:hypothetical protein